MESEQSALKVRVIVNFATSIVFVEALGQFLGYLPHEHIIGISKLTRLVRLFARRFAVQERLGEQIVNAFSAMLQPHGVAVYLEAHHLCTQMRGVRETSPLTRTTVWRGEYEHKASLRVEFLLTCGADL